MYAPVGAERGLAMAYDLDGDGLARVFDFVPVGSGGFDVGPRAAEIVRTVHPMRVLRDPADRGGPLAGLHR